MKQSLWCPPTYLLPNGSRTERMTGGIAEVFGATCRADACQPARPPCPLAKVHMQPGIFSWAHCDSDLRSDQLWWEWRVTLIPVLGTLNQSLSLGRVGWGGYWGSKLLLCNQSLARISFERRSWAFSTHCNVTIYLVVFSYFLKEIPKLT